MTSPALFIPGAALPESAAEFLASSALASVCTLPATARAITNKDALILVNTLQPSQVIFLRPVRGIVGRKAAAKSSEILPG